MKRIIEYFILGVAFVVIAYYAAPPFVELRRAGQAASDLEALSDGAKRFLEQTGSALPNLDALIRDPGIAGWDGPYLQSESLPRTPWGGDYGLDAARGLVGLPVENGRVPAKYRFGGIAEMSHPIREKPRWWASDNVSR